MDKSNKNGPNPGEQSLDSGQIQQDDSSVSIKPIPKWIAFIKKIKFRYYTRYQEIWWGIIFIIFVLSMWQMGRDLYFVFSKGWVPTEKVEKELFASQADYVSITAIYDSLVTPITDPNSERTYEFKTKVVIAKPIPDSIGTLKYTLEYHPIESYIDIEDSKERPWTFTVAKDTLIVPEHKFGFKFVHLRSKEKVTTMDIKLKVAELNPLTEQVTFGIIHLPQFINQIVVLLVAGGALGLRTIFPMLIKLYEIVISRKKRDE